MHARHTVCVVFTYMTCRLAPWHDRCVLWLACLHLGGGQALLGGLDRPTQPLIVPSALAIHPAASRLTLRLSSAENTGHRVRHEEYVLVSTPGSVFGGMAWHGV